MVPFLAHPVHTHRPIRN